jgi:AcrR family transcriptional regulator
VKPVPDIAVVDLCEKAGVSRKTFYKYYSDPFGLLLSMQDDLFVGFKAELVDIPANIYDIVPVLFRFADQHRLLLSATLMHRGEGNFIDRVIRYLYEAYREDWEKANPTMSVEEVHYLFYFVTSGLVGILRLWLLAQTDKNIDEIIKQAETMMKIATPA